MRFRALLSPRRASLALASVRKTVGAKCYRMNGVKDIVGGPVKANYRSQDSFQRMSSLWEILGRIGSLQGWREEVYTVGQG